VLRVETIGKIRRQRLVQGESISAIARNLGLSRIPGPFIRVGIGT
jgi:hypothetical protein